MNLDRWTKYAEIISSIAVVVTLVFLIVGLQENTSASRAASYANNLHRLNLWRMELADSEELTRIFMIYRDKDVSELDEIELQRLNFTNAALWGIYESAYFDRSYNTLAESEWRRFREQICAQFNIARRQVLWEVLSRRLNSEFREIVNADCGS